jgi:hypothetical protein
MPQQIFDRDGRCYKLSIVEGEALTCLQLHNQEILVGEAKCVRQSGVRLWLGDIAIANEANPLPENFWQRLLQYIPGYRPRLVNYRGRGLGAILIKALIQYAREQGIRSLQGEVFRQDIENTPRLLDWYQRQGFELRTPDPTDKPDVVAILHMEIRSPVNP